MSFKLNLQPQDVLEGLKAVVVGIQDRKVSDRFDNSADVKAFPFQVNLTIIDDVKQVNLGQNFSIKLKQKDEIEVGQIIDFDKTTIIGGMVKLWANNKGFVQISIKGDSLNVR